MENRIKERLTGAAIVVALLVLLVPEMFRGRPPPAPAAADSRAGPPERSYTIELRDRAPAPASTAPASTPAASGVLTSEQPALAAPPEPPPAAATTDAPAAAASTPQPVAATAPAAGGGTAADEPFQVQLGLFASRANADRLAAKVNRQGIRVTVSGPDARGLYRVHTATYASREAAQGTQQRLQQLGFTAALTPQR